MRQDSGQVIGAGCLQNLRRDASAQPDTTCPLEIGWRLRRDCWGQGLATEAAQAIVDFAFRGIHAGDVLAVCDPDNVASAKVMTRLGMVHRGVETWYGRQLTTYHLASPEKIISGISGTTPPTAISP